MYILHGLCSCGQRNLQRIDRCSVYERETGEGKRPMKRELSCRTFLNLLVSITFEVSGKVQKQWSSIGFQKLSETLSACKAGHSPGWHGHSLASYSSSLLNHLHALCNSCKYVYVTRPCYMIWAYLKHQRYYITL